MAIATAFVALMMTQATAITVSAPAPEFDVGYEQLVAGQPGEAILRIEGNTTLSSDDPALLINKGVALARTGQIAQARESFRAAVMNDARFDLETATGEWVDSRALARRGIDLLDQGHLDQTYALLVR